MLLRVQNLRVLIQCILQTAHHMLFCNFKLLNPRVSLSKFLVVAGFPHFCSLSRPYNLQLVIEKLRLFKVSLFMPKTVRLLELPSHVTRSLSRSHLLTLFPSLTVIVSFSFNLHVLTECSLHPFSSAAFMVLLSEVDLELNVLLLSKAVICQLGHYAVSLVLHLMHHRCFFTSLDYFLNQLFFFVREVTDSVLDFQFIVFRLV
jgi:hypothetical protein